MKIYVVSAFSMNGSGGNKAGVLLDELFPILVKKLH